VAARVPDEMKKSRLWEHRVNAPQRLDAIDDARTLIDEDARLQALGERFDEQTCGQMRAPLEPAGCAPHVVLALIAEKQLCDHTHQPVIHVEGRLRALPPPLRHCFRTEEVHLRQAVHLWVLAEHTRDYGGERTRRAEDDEKRIHHII
jgi:hypothetical protein